VGWSGAEFWVPSIEKSMFKYEEVEMAACSEWRMLVAGMLFAEDRRDDHGRASITRTTNC
jgi:hypothetical protein